MAEKVTTGTAVPQGGGHGKVFPPLDAKTFAPQLVWLALTFGLLYVLVKRFLPRIGRVIQERKERMQRDLDRAEKLKVETQAALAAYEASLAEARAKAHAIVKDMRDKLVAETDKERAKVEAQIARQLTEAEARIAQTKAKALSGVNDIAGDVAAAVVARLIGTEVSRDEVQKALLRRAAE
jgi:F-type H+-transporting ATPase subunit b